MRLAIDVRKANRPCLFFKNNTKGSNDVRQNNGSPRGPPLLHLLTCLTFFYVMN